MYLYLRPIFLHCRRNRTQTIEKLKKYRKIPEVFGSNFCMTVVNFGILTGIDVDPTSVSRSAIKPVSSNPSVIRCTKPLNFCRQESEAKYI